MEPPPSSTRRGTISPDKQTLLFHFNSLFTAGERYLTPSVKMEFGACSDPWPAESRKINPIAATVFPKAFADPEVMVNTLLPTRTFWEKAMLLHEETFRPEDKPRRPRMARHYYDLYQLIEKGVAQDAVNDKGLFGEVARHRQVFFKHRWVDYSTLKPGTLRLVPLPKQEDRWRADYGAMGEMFSSTPPSFDSILKTVKNFEIEFNS